MYRPYWQLPPGVSRGTWDYVQSESIAREYDEDLAGHPLFRLDLEVIREYLPPLDSSETPPLVADLGCGTGRVARELLPAGYRVLNIDLSEAMLRRASMIDDPLDHSLAIRANLAELSCLANDCLDLAVCLFSSYGMLRGREHRIRFLSNLRRSLKSHAFLIIHVHNRYHSMFDPGGIRWLLKSRVASLLRRGEFGDREYAYRGLPTMFLHIFSRRELIREIRSAGFTDLQLLAINTQGTELLTGGTCCSGLRAGGFFAIARKTG